MPRDCWGEEEVEEAAQEVSRVHKGIPHVGGADGV